MKSGTCPKCNSRRVARFGGAISIADDDGSAISIGGVATAHYVCADCRYFESWLAGDGPLKSVDEDPRFEWVNPTPDGPFR